MLEELQRGHLRGDFSIGGGFCTGDGGILMEGMWPFRIPSPACKCECGLFSSWCEMYTGQIVSLCDTGVRERDISGCEDR